MMIHMRTVDANGALVECYSPGAEDASEDAAEARFRRLGATLNEVRGQKSWVSKIFRNGQHIATCRKGVWRRVKP